MTDNKKENKPKPRERAGRNISRAIKMLDKGDITGALKFILADCLKAISKDGWERMNAASVVTLLKMYEKRVDASEEAVASEGNVIDLFLKQQSK